jgi:competence protein ComEA
VERVRGQLFWWVAAAVIGALAVARLLGGCGQPQPVAPVRVQGGAPGARPSRSAQAAPAAAKLYVHVAGRVRRPGLYRLSSGARVAAAIDQAGGPARRADIAKVNLAARIEDGQQIVVPRLGAGPAGGAAGVGAAGAGSAVGGGAGAKLSLGSATAEQLDGLDGIGPTLAKRIVAYRDAHGGFRSLGQLRDVEGIGEKRFASLQKAVGP